MVDTFCIHSYNPSKNIWKILENTLSNTLTETAHCGLESVQCYLFRHRHGGKAHATYNGFIFLRFFLGKSNVENIHRKKARVLGECMELKRNDDGG